MKRFLFSGLLIAGMSLSAGAQDFQMPKPSPITSVSQEFSTSTIKLDYSRPSMKGRTIFGHLVPFGQLWRTGANSATQITFGEDVIINDKVIKKGEYSLYTIPEKDEWTIILNTEVGNWGASGFDEKDDVLKFKVPANHSKDTQETFTISVENITTTTCDIVFSWADTEVSFGVKADNNKRILAHLEKELSGKKPPYSTAAGYYLMTNQKLDDAAKYYELAIKEKPKAFYLNWGLAQVYEKLGKHDEALKAAEKSAELSKGSAYESEYEQHYKDMKNAK